MCAVNQRKQVPTAAAHPERTESEGLKPIVSVAQTHRLITPFGCSKCSLSLTSREPQPAEKERYLRKAGHSPKRTLGKHSKFHCYLNGSKISILGNRMLVLVLKQKWSAEASPQRGEHQSIPSDPSLLFGAQSLLLNTKTKTNKQAFKRTHQDSSMCTRIILCVQHPLHLNAHVLN